VVRSRQKKTWQSKGAINYREGFLHCLRPAGIHGTEVPAIRSKFPFFLGLMVLLGNNPPVSTGGFCLLHPLQKLPFHKNGRVLTGTPRKHYSFSFFTAVWLTAPITLPATVA
jgi:hypothetical protein